MSRPDLVTGRRAVLRGAVAALVLLAMAACGGMPAGSALDTSGMDEGGLATIRPGTEIGIKLAVIDNKESVPITLLAINLAGSGLGRVVRPVQMKIAAGRGSVPISAYVEDPPVQPHGNGKCAVQPLKSVRGYVLRPHATVNIWTVLLGLRPGKYHVTGNVVSYQQGGLRFQQTVPQGYSGRVKARAPLLHSSADGGRPCLRLTHLLKGTLP